MGGWEHDETIQEAAIRFKSKTHQDEFNPEGCSGAAMFAMSAEEELESWPEQSTRNRKWLTVTEAADSYRYPWTRALIEGFATWRYESTDTERK
ncbi:Nudix hydrolase 16- mitochondrial [Striga hermonthica]|uniref:Nudix hydrolase 16- mitochondrial n=1 Tax=Striga hermonthica TaxID=68872 RepID=A0A9N7RPS4_STRHE|nr:Nudix hydrolase 16- mitochondrial [Striga hermonthica]